MPGSSECIFSPRMVALSAFERRGLARSQSTYPAGIRREKIQIMLREASVHDRQPISRGCHRSARTPALRHVSKFRYPS